MGFVFYNVLAHVILLIKNQKKMSTLEGIKVKDYQLIIHLNLTKVHRSKYSGVFDCEGSPLHGRKFFHESDTEIKGYFKYGKTTSLFYLSELNSKEFKTIKALVSFYNKS